MQAKRRGPPVRLWIWLLHVSTYTVYRYTAVDELSNVPNRWSQVIKALLHEAMMPSIQLDCRLFHSNYSINDSRVSPDQKHTWAQNCTNVSTYTYIRIHYNNMCVCMAHTYLRMYTCSWVSRDSVHYMNIVSRSCKPVSMLLWCLSTSKLYCPFDLGLALLCIVMYTYVHLNKICLVGDMFVNSKVMFLFC